MISLKGLDEQRQCIGIRKLKRYTQVICFTSGESLLQAALSQFTTEQVHSLIFSLMKLCGIKPHNNGRNFLKSFLVKQKALLSSSSTHCVHRLISILFARRLGPALLRIEARVDLFSIF